MSTMALTWALNGRLTGPMPAETRLVLAALADYAGADHQAWPSAVTLADQLMVSVRSVRRHLAALEEHALIERGDQELVSHYRADRRPVVWRLAVPEHPAGRGVGRVTPRRDGVTPVTERGDSHGHDGVTALSPKPRTKPPMETPPPNPREAGEPCPTHGDNPEPGCRGCGTSPRQLRRAAINAADAAERAGRPPLCERCGIRHPGACLELGPPPTGWRDAAHTDHTDDEHEEPTP